MEDVLAHIARQHLNGLETLELRNSDQLDFYDVSVATLKQMLKAAYLAGQGNAVR
jgi:hypothetical protein